MSLFLYLINLYFIISVYEPNISNVDLFVENLYNFSLNFSDLGKLSAFINAEQYCSIYNSNLSICLKCEENYILLNGECVCYDRNCKICSSSLYGACTECHIGYALSADNTCRCKINHCLLCDDNICNVCENGYILSKFNTSCEYNKEYDNGLYCYEKNCDICMNKLKGACLKCKDGYNLVNGSCFENPSLGYYFESKMLCPDNYISVGEGCNKVCLGAQCNISEQPLYASCGSECIHCIQGILYDSLNCNMSNYCYDEKCTKCRTNEIGMCDRCEIGYRLLYGKCEEKCLDDNCLNCDYTIDGSCNWCKKGYILMNGNCYIKIEGFSKDELFKLYEEGLKDYADLYNISYLGKGNIKVFSDNSSIILDYSDLIDDFHLNKFKNICSIENCKSCLLNNSQYCINCINDYLPLNGRCINCLIL
jgi:hypothetical protein